MKSRYSSRWIVIFLSSLFIFHCDNPLGTDHDQYSDLYWSDLMFEVLYEPNNWCSVFVIDSVYSGYVEWQDTSNFVYFTSSLGDHESSMVNFEHGSWGGGIWVMHGQTYQKMDHILHLPPKDQEGWVSVSYYSQYSNQLCCWRIVWEVEEPTFKEEI